MAEIITMPKLGFDMAEGTLVEWSKKVGDAVGEGEIIAIIETDKANVEVPSFHAGVVRYQLVDAGAVVPVGQPIAVIGSADETIDLTALGVKEGAPKEGQAEGKIEAKEAAAPAAAPESQVPATAAGTSAPTSPVARRLADELGVDLQHVRGSGPGGRIVKRDIEEYLKERDKAPKVVAPPPVPTPSFGPSAEAYHTEPLSPIRKTIARRMSESKQQAPHFYITIEVDMAATMSLRQQLNALLPEEEKISVNDLIVKAAALTLKAFPRLNSSFAGDEIHLHDQINVGIAVDRKETGLVTTVIRECDKKSLAQIAADVRSLVGRAREGLMRADDMTGGTFTISNLGMFGVEDFVAIINPPQAAILAVGAIMRVPVVNEAGELAVGTRMKVTISADHRVTDGAEAARFLQALKAILEQPLRLLM